ncbi:iditol 2-dehydrogenase [Bacillus sp. SA1-12]|uniref:galactitol-1-phosphate 5-dehydrogenase n=1 Tax=Bacillus sp. SA1-12 TaxID=1455638 RepID=UPI0006260BE5|nr:galactitol-1-phosphate 5-dehydrogenase [Bacillus sp. SA1-12]KKI91842.1 iditol 2-dehydrogenase [Bacillus sp. SA1-12]
MESLCFYGIQDLRYEESPQPTIDRNDEVIIRVRNAGICGSDISRYKKLGPLKPGNIWGHEYAGEVVEIGQNVTDINVGARVAVCPALYCGKCEYCRSGYIAACPDLLVTGAKVPGGFATYVKVPRENVICIPESVSFEEATFVEPSAVSLHGLFKTSLQPGYSVAVMGCGTIGLLAIQWAKIFGAEIVYAIDLEKEKLTLAKQVGADILINPKDENTFEQIMTFTNGNGVDLAVEAAGSPITSSQIFALPKKGGEVVFMGIPYADVSIERFYFERIVRQELKVYGSWNAVSSPFPGREFHTTIHFMNTGQLQVKPLISHRVPLRMGPEIFERIISNKEVFTKVMFEL